MHVYIIGDDGITRCHAVAAVLKRRRNCGCLEWEIACRSVQRQAAGGAVECPAGCREARKIGARDALIDPLWSAIEALPDPKPDARRLSKQDAVITLLRRAEAARWRPQSERRAAVAVCACFAQTLRLLPSDPNKDAAASTTAPALKPGSRLLREWHGRTTV